MFTVRVRSSTAMIVVGNIGTVWLKNLIKLIHPSIHCFLLIQGEHGSRLGRFSRHPSTQQHLPATPVGAHGVPSPARIYIIPPSSFRQVSY